MRISDWSFRRVLFRSLLSSQHPQADQHGLPRDAGLAEDRAKMGACRVATPVHLLGRFVEGEAFGQQQRELRLHPRQADQAAYEFLRRLRGVGRSEEHTSELQSLMRSSYAVFCLKEKKPKSMKSN